MSQNHGLGEQTREQLLEEIRKRAEKAELARIEAEELRLALDPRNTNIASPNTNEELDASLAVSVLREGLSEALASRDLDRATVLYNEIREMLPDDPVVNQYEAEIRELRLQLGVEPPEAQALDHDDVKLAQLYNDANDAYLHERYDEALQKVDQLLSKDATHAAALDLRRSIEKAKHLADLLAAEEQARKEKALQESQQVTLPAPPPAESPAPSHQQVDAVEHQGPPEASSPSHSSRAVEEETAPEGVVTGFLAFLRRRKWFVVLGTILVVLALQTAFVVYEQLLSTFMPHRTSLVVVPIGYGPNTEEPLAQGMTDEFIVRLAQFPEINVFATTTSLRRAATDVDGLRLAGRLGAECLLLLGVYSTPESLIVKATLKDLANNRVALEQLFSEHRNELARIPLLATPLIARALGVTVPTELSTSPTHLPPGEAFERYLIARKMLHSSRSEDLDSIGAILQDAVLQDSLFGEALTLLGWTHVLAYEASRETVQTRLEQARLCLQRSVGLGTKGSEVYRLWGMIEYFQGRPQDAVQRLEEASRMAPSDAETLRRLALAQLRIGRSQQALETAAKAVQSDPGNDVSYRMLGMIDLLLDKSEAALHEFQTALALSPRWSNAGRKIYLAALVANNRHEQAIDLAKQHVTRQSDDIEALYELGRMYQLAGKPQRMWAEAFQRAREVALQHLKDEPTNIEMLSYLALTETRLGNFKQGLSASAKALAIAPNDYPTLYNATRVRALQSGRTPETYAFLARAIYRRFSLDDLLDLDLMTLRRDPEFIRKITQ